MGSTRLPGKTLAHLCGKPLLQLLIDRVRASELVKDVIIATTTNPQDDILAEFAEKQGLKCYRGSEADVLDRTYQTARCYGVDPVVRVTPDCPLLDPSVLDRVILRFLQGGVDYVSNTNPPTYPDGMDTEVFSFGALQRAWQEATLASEREHVTPYIWKNTRLFTVANVTCETDLSHVRLTVDYPEDLDFLRAVLKHLPHLDPPPALQDILRVLGTYPELLNLRPRFQRNEGYLRSLDRDRDVGGSRR